MIRAFRLIPFLCAASWGFWGGNSPKTNVTEIHYDFDDREFTGRLVTPAKPPKSLPAIVLFPDWMGVTPRAVEDARGIAEWGYAVWVADLFGRNSQPQSQEEAARLTAELRKDPEMLRRRAVAALEALRGQRGVDTVRIAAMGYCFGGMTALELARTTPDLRGTVSIHGNLKPAAPEETRTLRGAVLVLHGAEDPLVPPEEVKAFEEEARAAGVDWQIVHYGGAVHSFTNPQAGSVPGAASAYHPKAAARARVALRNFLAEVTKPQNGKKK